MIVLKRLVHKYYQQAYDLSCKLGRVERTNGMYVFTPNRFGSKIWGPEQREFKTLGGLRFFMDQVKK